MLLGFSYFGFSFHSLLLADFLYSYILSPEPWGHQISFAVYFLKNINTNESEHEQNQTQIHG